ncbi:hypothetical protein [Pedobacter sp. WC2423]|uniref:hypothetical protein n=1 Tax=Pedobacter sp. WC2423 TaxID=3234142 RepID=UPI0034678096
MKKSLLLFSAVFCLLQLNSAAQVADSAELARSIRSDKRLDTIQARAIQLLTGFSADTSYDEVWIRDFNTFIKGALKIQPKEKVRNMLLMFFKIQGDDGNIVDGVVDSAQANGGYQYCYSALLPGWAAHKNTVETDQESSLIQAVKKYIDVTGDQGILFECIKAKTILQRMEESFSYILKERWSEQYGLVKGATTIDWGDVQPEKGWGVAVNAHTKWAIDIYDNAMFVMAIHDFLAMKPKDYQTQQNWAVLASTIKTNVRKHLWMPEIQKYRPHLYLDGSPFSKTFNEDQILYAGGSVCAILAGFNTLKEVQQINLQLVAAAAKEKFATIGFTVYPPYPESEFPNMLPYSYQNGGDWTWFGGRMISGLITHKLVKEAYAELMPMVDRAIVHKGFYEWYNVQTGEAKGSGDFRGEAGVLFDAVESLKRWAAKN